MKNSIKLLLIILMIASPMLGNDQPVTTLFSHGLADTFAQAYKYVKRYLYKGVRHTNERYIITGPTRTFNYPDAKGPLAKLCRVNFTQTSLGQDNEIEALSEEYYKIPATESVVLVGLSRGASTALNFAAMHRPKNLKALVLESPFDTVMGIVRDKTNNNALRSLAKILLTCHIPFFKYNISGIHALAKATDIPKDLPILIVCSLEDATVPAASSLRLYNKLKATGHINVDFVLLPRGQHSKLLQGPDGYIYQAATHAFYKRHGLPHDPILAEQAADFLPSSAAQ